MDEELKPWDVHPALTLEYLARVRKLAWDVQKAIATRMEPHHGDDLWIAGCRAFKWRLRSFSLAATAEYSDWLSVGFIRNQFVFRIKGIPVRMYHAAADGEVPERYVQATEEERAMLSFAFELYDTPTPELVYRLEIETDEKANPLAVLLVQVDAEGKRYNPFVIPAPLEVVLDADAPEQLDQSVRAVVPRKRAIVLPEAEVVSRKEAPEIAIDGTSA